LRGVVVEKNKNGLILLTNEGQFIKIRKHVKPVEIGQEIEVEDNTFYKTEVLKKIVSIAASLLFLLGGLGVFSYNTVYGYVDIDINPSIELSYNLYKRVIKIESLNDDGKNLLEGVKGYKNKPVEDVINKVIDNAIKENYISDRGENTVLVTITEDKNNIDHNKILEKVDTHLKNSSIEAEVIVMKSDKESREAAKKNSLSPGKAKLIEKAVDLKEDINPEEIKDKSVKEIINIINEAKKYEKKQKNTDVQEEKENKDEEKIIEKENRRIEEKTRKSHKSNDKKILTNENKDHKTIHGNKKLEHNNKDKDVKSEEQYNSRFKDNVNKANKNIVDKKHKYNYRNEDNDDDNDDDDSYDYKKLKKNDNKKLNLIINQKNNRKNSQNANDKNKK